MANAGLALPDTLGRHSPLSSVIRVSVQRDAVHVSFSVADQGRGIPAASLVLLNLMLPGANGVELMQDILGIATVPVIFVSA